METLEKNFKKTMYVGYETSMSPNVDREEKVMHYNVGWNRDEERGWFEMYDEESGGEEYYGEGGLWFDGNILTDYDGVFSLDENIIQCLKKWGANTLEFEI
jgi:hypothetical protein